MSEDTCLIIQAQQKATGANIHKVANVVGAYQRRVHLVELYRRDRNPLGAAGNRAAARALERKLRAFLHTGEITL
jgi:hypothetical protein